MKGTEALGELGRRPVFTSAEARSLLGKGPAYANLYLHRLKAAGRLFEVERGKFTVHDDPFIVASRIAWPSYISLWSDLRYHDLTEQAPHAVWVVTSRRRKRRRIRYAGTDILFTVTGGRNMFGYDKRLRDGQEIFVADPEKAIIDSLLFGKVSVAEVFEIIRTNLPRIRTGRLVDYAARTGSQALAKRLGLLLERAGKNPASRQLKGTYAQIIPLDRKSPRAGTVNRKWKLIENVAL